MSAIRLARGYTGRDVLIKFEGCYHGHSDGLLVKAGSGLLTFGNPSSSGVPAGVAENTMVLTYNDPQELAEAFAKHGDKIAAVIVEPVVGNMNLIAPTQAFLNAMRELCTQNGSVLIFDEVMTGFRVGLKSAQGLFGITPDLSTFGKVVGGGMPLGAFGGKREIMEMIAPLGPVYQAGTLSGNPVATACGPSSLRSAETWTVRLFSSTTTPGQTSGRLTRSKVCNRFNPSSCAASSISTGIEAKKLCRIQIANARLNAAFTRIIASQKFGTAMPTEASVIAARSTGPLGRAAAASWCASGRRFPRRNWTRWVRAIAGCACARPRH